MSTKRKIDDDFVNGVSLLEHLSSISDFKDSSEIKPAFKLKRKIRRRRVKLTRSRKAQKRRYSMESYLERKCFKKSCFATKLEKVKHDHNYHQPQCHLCFKFYKNANSLRRHIYASHKEKISRIKCAICKESLANNELYFAHLESSHQLKVNINEITFQSEIEFNSWLESVNDSSSFCFRLRGQTATTNGYVKHLYCNRSGFLQPSKTYKGERCKSTMKIGGRCPAKIKIEKAGNFYFIKFISTHVGHVCKSHSKSLSSKMKEDIKKEKLKIRQLHSIALELEMKTHFDKKSESFQIISNEDDRRLFNIKKISGNCVCNIKCDICKVCIHMFRCSCSKYIEQQLLCEHIHYYVRNSNLEDEMPVETMNDCEEIFTSESQHSFDASEDTNISKDEKNELMDYLYNFVNDLANEDINLFKRYVANFQHSAHVLSKVNFNRKFISQTENSFKTRD